MMSAPFAVFIESNTTGSGADFLVRAFDLGLTPVLITHTPSRYGFLSRMPEVAVHTCNTKSPEAVTDCIDDLARVAPIALVMSTSDAALGVAAQQSHRLGLPGSIPEAIALCRNKSLQAEVLQNAGVTVPPRSVLVSDTANSVHAVMAVGLPAVVKPVSGTGSIGVSLVTTIDEATAALTTLLSNETDATSALLMAYVDGAEFSVELLDAEVVGVTQKHLGALPYFVETGHDYPAPLKPALQASLELAAKRAVLALGHTRGPAHVELRVANDTVTVIEVNPRLAGGSIPRLIQLATGVDIVSAVLASARGQRPSIERRHSTHGSIRFVVPRTNGPFWTRHEPTTLVQRFGLAECVLYRDMPIEFTRQNDFRDRLGHVIAIDEDPTAAAARAEAAVAAIIDN